jgi:signal transduction histidine kinase/PAS domain-containing protein
VTGTKKPSAGFLRSDLAALALESSPVRYAAAAIASFGALALTWLLHPYLSGRVFTFAYGAVAIGGALGIGPATLATLICLAGIDFFFLAPGSSVLVEPTDFLSLVMFLVVAVLIIALASRLRAARRTAAQSEAFSRAIIESMSDPLVVHDAGWRFQYINEPAMQMFRTSKHHLPASLIGQRLWDLYPELPDTVFGENLLRAARERKPLSFEAYYPERGEWSDLNCYPLADGGLVTAWKNVTERHQTEEAQRYLAQASALLGKSLDVDESLQSLAEMVVPDLADWCRVDMVSPDGGVRLVTVTHTDPEKVKWAQRLAEDYPTQMDAPAGLPNVLRTGVAEVYPDITEEMLAEGVSDPEHLALLKTVQFRGVVIAPIVSPRGVIGALTLVSAESRRRYGDREVSLATELGRRAGMAVENARILEAEKAARAAAVQAQRSAEEANAAKSQFLAFMSHELRTPLNAISGYVDLILAGVHGPVSAAQQNALEKVNRSQRKLLGLINNVLNFVRLDAGHVDINPSVTAAGALLDEVESLIAPQLDAKGIAYEFSCADGATFYADADKTQQILLNLLSNAIKFTDGGGRIDMECTSEDDRVFFRVRDTGCGIAADKLNAVFEPFVQIDRTLKSAHEGTGLGLAISRDLAEQMRGALTVESEVGKGSVFTLVLPSAPPATQRRTA